MFTSSSRNLLPVREGAVRQGREETEIEIEIENVHSLVAAPELTNR